MACGELYLSIGIVFIDDIILPNGESRMARLGGGAVHASMGMRLWAEHVGLSSPLGEDLPNQLRQQMGDLFDIQGVVERPIQSPRAWMVYEPDGTRHEVFRTDPSKMVNALVRPEEYPEAYKKAKGIHLHCVAEEVPMWAEFLKNTGDPVVLWEPWDRVMVLENRDLFRQNAASVDVVSPNLNEGRLMTGKTEPNDVLQALLNLDAKCVVLRMGEHGSLIGDEDGRRIWVPGMSFGPVVDVTGAGNAYCGGFVVGLARTGDLLHAGCCGAVSASFALQQFGAVYDPTDLHEEAESRFETTFANTPNPKRFAFDKMADVWDDIAKTHTKKTAKLERIAKAGALSSSSMVLDIGTGTGGLLPALKACEPESIIAVDLSLAMLRKARSNYPELSVNKISLSEADASYLPFSADIFSAVYCHGVFPHLIDFPMVLRELGRVLAPGGRLVISHAIGRERVNAIHSCHKSAILRDDLLPTGRVLTAILIENEWKVLECEDKEDFYLLQAEKPDD
jgi:sugar/nucleoside kinase (ribokinase family)/SAM-dependent methyltransferase